MTVRLHAHQHLGILSTDRHDCLCLHVLSICNLSCLLSLCLCICVCSASAPESV